MKTLLLVRHAKSGDHFSDSSDFERTLNEQGVNAAPKVAKYLLSEDVLIQRFVSSPAVRAQTTARLFMKEYHRPAAELVLIDELYLASVPVFVHTVTELDDADDHVAIFAHNPGITEFASSLTTVRIDNMPTAGVFAVKADVDSWSEFMPAAKDFLFFESPKRLS